MTVAETSKTRSVDIPTIIASSEYHGDHPLVPGDEARQTCVPGRSDAMFDTDDKRVAVPIGAF